MRKKRVLINVSISIMLLSMALATGWACSSSKNSTGGDGGNQQAADPSFSHIFVASESISLAGSSYQSSLYLSSNGEQNRFFQYVKGRQSSNGVVIFMVPYTGLDWSEQSVDKDLSSRANATVGYWVDDIYGPQFQKSTSKQIFYQMIPRAQLPSVGLGFLFNNYNVLFLHNRFYAGRFASDYVRDISAALDFLDKNESQLNIAFYGMSLGGFIPLQALSRINHPRIKALVAVSPLVSWIDQNHWIETANTTFADPLKLQKFRDFFEPYQRRFLNNEASNYDTPTVQYPTLLFHDEWDVLVSIRQAERLFQKSQSKVNFLRYYHSTSINYDTMNFDHKQEGSGMNEFNVLPFAQAFIFNQFQDNQVVQYLTYKKIPMDTMFAEMKAAKDNGRDLGGFKSGISEICKTKYFMWELDSAEAPTLGPQYLSSKLNMYFGTNFNEYTVCTSIPSL